MNNPLKDKTCLVTGASGFIGSHVTKLLIEQGARVRVLLRRTSPVKFLDPFPVEKYIGDVSDIPSLQKAIDGIEILFHVAGVVAFGRGDITELRRVNVQGVRNVLGIAQDFKVKRVVLTSSVAAIGPSPTPRPVDETLPWDEKAPHSDYSRSKHDGEMEAMKFYREGLPLVIVNPSLVMGSPDYGPSVAGQLIFAYLRRKFKAYMTMGFNCVDVKDVAKGHLLAATKGRLGERYILANENKTLIEFLRLLEKYSGVKAPQFRLPYPLAYGGAVLVEGANRIFGKSFPLDRRRIESTRYYNFYSHEKAARELGWVPRPFEETLSEMVGWFREFYNPRMAAS